MARLAMRLDGLGARQASRMLLHPLDAQELFANGRRVVPRRRRRALERPAEERRQGKGQGQRLGDVEIKACSPTSSALAARAIAAAGTQTRPIRIGLSRARKGSPKKREPAVHPAIGPCESARFPFCS